MPLKGKRVFITGGTGGIGRPLVLQLLEAGAIVDVYDRQKDGDLYGGIENLHARLAADAPDILINMAGYTELAHCEEQDARQLLAVNLLAPIRLAQAVLPAMKARGRGQIVNIGSMTGLIPLPHLTCYVAAKAGLKGFSDALRRELAGSGIQVTHVTPRAVDTGANKGIKSDLNRQAGVAQDDPEIVAARIFRAIRDREADVRIGWPERFFAVMNALLPKLVDQGLKKNRDIGEKLLNDDKQSRSQTMKKALPVIAALLALATPSFAEGTTAATTTAAPRPALVQTKADPMLEKLAALQSDWAAIKYGTDSDDAKLTAIHKLEETAAAFSAAYADKPEPKIWQAIVLATDAGIVKGVSALGKVKDAKKLLEAALAQNPKALDGSAYTTLGSLYYQVPGWPIGFGDEDKAEKFLKQALVLNPDGIDPNYFYGDFLLKQKKYDEAVTVLNKALAAPDRPGRAAADAGRRKEIKAALAKAEENAGKKSKDSGYN
jgi:short-subunit dehydrogenase/tetratricopeptide (TPR) repeat protein